MPSAFSRGAAVFAAASLLALPATASAAEVDEYAAEASTSAVELSIFEEIVGSPVLDLVGTDALASSDPTASALVEALTVAGNEVVAATRADSTGDRSRSPGDGDGCQTLANAIGLTLDAVCAIALADAGASDEVRTVAETQLLTVGVDGSLLGALLTQPLTDSLNELTAPLTDGAVADALDQFTAACNAALENLPDEADEIPNVVSEVISLLPPEADAITEPVQDILDEVADDACNAVINLTINDVVGPIINLDQVAGALEGVSLLTVEVDGASSTITGSADDLVATGQQAFVRVGGPPLSILSDAITGLLNGLEDGIVGAIVEVAGAELPVPEDFDLSDEVAGVLDMLPLVSSDQPMVTAAVDGGRATATLDNGDATAAPGGAAPSVTVTIADAVYDLLGVDPETIPTSFEAGQSQTIAEGTPLASTISVGELTTDEDAELDGLPGTSARSSATTLALFQGEGTMGGIVLALGESTAAVYGANAVDPAPEPEPQDPLPNTGGGAAAAAVLALGAAAALRRRRD